MGPQPLPGVEATPGVEHRVIRVDGNPVSVYSAGAPSHPSVVLLHGAMYDEARFVWDQVFFELAGSYRVHAIDAPRHGRSRPWPGHLGNDRLLGILEQTFLALGLERFNLVGLLMGGGLSIGYAARHPEQVISAALFEPGGLGDKLDRHVLTWLWIRTPGTRRLLNRWLVRKRRPALMKTLRSLYVGGSRPTAPDRLVGILKDEVDGKARFHESDLDDWQTDAVGPLRLTWNLLDQIPALACPTLWLRGADSVMVKQHEMERAVSLAGVDANLVVIPGAGHLLPLERPHEVRQALLAFLDSHNSL
ncbi:alpha/beta fold hydrolase [Mobilicoccus massiliensis]|uniref:alpha/beta fold hydrolase n=1 Tax=Mobilicoccus massiliensis TaxID=1522310 RepID=UPI000693BBB1|nr:alpha/beta hydrolase [Mobilicoccus massiliensis]